MRLDDRLTQPQGTFYLPGMSMLVRLTLEQAWRDHDAGLRTQTLVTGSPPAGSGLQVARVPGLLSEPAVRHLPAGNEEQAVGALTGSQMLDDYPHETCEGVTGFWYGKGPGLDRAVTRWGMPTSPAPAPAERWSCCPARTTRPSRRPCPSSRSTSSSPPGSRSCWLRCGRKLRGSPLDPFGRQTARRQERALIDCYEGVIDRALGKLRPLTAGTVLRIAQLPDMIRGYEQVKAAGAAQARAAAQDLLPELDRPAGPSPGGGTALTLAAR